MQTVAMLENSEIEALKNLSKAVPLILKALEEKGMPARSKNTEIPDFGMLCIEQITSSAKEGRVGILPISRTTWLRLIRKGYVPKGELLIGNKLAWRVADIREIVKRVESGEFMNINLSDEESNT